MKERASFLSWHVRRWAPACAILAVLAALIGACTNGNAPPSTSSATQPGGWKAVLIAGDDAEPAFDNAVDAMDHKLVTYGLKPQDIVVLKSSAADEHAASRENVINAFHSLAPAGTDGCFVFVTSHGANGRGLIIKAAQSFLTPADLNGFLNQSCGNRPTVVIASGCFSGIFANGEAMPAANRTILTAARSDRTSFGCNASRQLTIFDECVLDGIGRGVPWRAVMDRTRACVSRHETEENFQPPSEPQIFVGRNVDRQVAFPY